ncbi:MAG: hypothetical protein IJC66_00335 [Kiritimatiellae bacterium]|nr:hypothetical protein [Kiritimatiellia bacterium]
MQDTDKAAVLSAAKAALSEGENFRAYDIAEKIPDDGESPLPEKIRIMALALARSGSLKRARELAARLPDSDDAEIAGLKSRLFKDMAIAASAPAEKRDLFAKAAYESECVFARKGVWYNGINAAACRFMAGEREKARRLVRSEVLPRCKNEKNKDFWLDATLGECHLLLGHYKAASEFYEKAATEATDAGHFGSLSSTLRQLRMLVSEIGKDAERVWTGLSLPGIAVFSGHMIDRPDRPNPRFPAYAEDIVRLSLREIVSKRKIKIAFASCACGGDILFLEEVLSAGGECIVVPPLPLKTTIRNSVAFAPGDWEARLKTIRDNPRTRLLAPECDETGENDAIVYDFANRYLLGLATLKSRELGFPLFGVCVWDGKESGLAGGTDSAVRLWRDQKLSIEIVTPEVRQ